MDEPQPKKPFQFSLTTVLLLLVIVAMGLGWFKRAVWDEEKFLRPIDRSWHDGTVTVEPYRNGNELGIEVSGNWPSASPDLWIRHSLFFIQDGSRDHCVVAIGGYRLGTFLSGVGVSDYSGANLLPIDRSRPYQAVFDYEIWEGRPGEGQLLKKDSVFSAPIVESELIDVGQSKVLQDS